METWSNNISIDRVFDVASLIMHMQEVGGGSLPKATPKATDAGGVTLRELVESVKFLIRLGYTGLEVFDGGDEWLVSFPMSSSDLKAG